MNEDIDGDGIKDDDKKCKLTSIEFLFVIIRDVKELNEKLNIEELKTKYDSGYITSDTLFDLAEKNVSDADIKKDILMYKEYSKSCKWKDID